MITPRTKLLISSACREGRLDLLEQWEEAGYIDHDDPESSWYPAYAAINGHLDIIEFFKEKGISPTFHAANAAAENGHIYVLEWLENEGILPNTMGADAAMVNEQHEVLEWLKKRGITHKISPRTAHERKKSDYWNSSWNL